MSSAVPQGQDALVAEPILGTQVLFRSVKWQNQQAYMRAQRIGVFHKGDVPLVVHQYGHALCGVLILADVKPKIRDFREWREPFATVKGKVEQRGWSLVRDSEEVSHATH